MARMIFDLTEEDRAALEAHRVRLGLRSGAEALRALIRGQRGMVIAEDWGTRTLESAPGVISAFRPHPKPGKK